MLAGVQFKVRMGKPSTEGLKCVFPMNRFGKLLLRLEMAPNPLCFWDFRLLFKIN
jgi:hypothetical protein